MKIPAYSSTIRRKEMDAVLSCMVSEKIGPGETNSRLLRQVKEFLGVDGAFAVRSPAIALKYACLALDLPPQSGIMLSALAPFWQYQTIESLGYKPIVLDVAEQTALVTLEQVEDGIKNGGRLLLLNETFGLIPDIDSYAALGIPIIEDISQSVGGIYNEKRVGTLGVFSILGLEANDLVTAGGGAVLLAPLRRNASVLRKLAEEAPKTDILPDINCALGFIQLKELVRNETIRREMFDTFVRSVLQSGHRALSQQGDFATTSIYSFPVVLKSGFKEVQSYANRKDIEVLQAFENSIAEKLYDTLDCKIAKSLLLRCAQFPLYPRLGKSQVEKLAKVLAALP